MYNFRCSTLPLDNLTLTRALLDDTSSSVVIISHMTTDDGVIFESALVKMRLPSGSVPLRKLYF